MHNFSEIILRSIAYMMLKVSPPLGGVKVNAQAVLKLRSSEVAFDKVALTVFDA